MGRMYGLEKHWTVEADSPEEALRLMQEHVRSCRISGGDLQPGKFIHSDGKQRWYPPLPDDPNLEFHLVDGNSHGLGGPGQRAVCLPKGEPLPEASEHSGGDPRYALSDFPDHALVADRALGTWVKLSDMRANAGE